MRNINPDRFFLFFQYPYSSNHFFLSFIVSVAQQEQQLPQQEVGGEQGLDLESGEAGLNKQMKQKC